MMQIRKTRFGMTAVALAAFTLPAAAFAQFTGTSHPEETPVGTAQDSTPVPHGYVPTPKPSAAAPYTPSAQLQQRNVPTTAANAASTSGTASSFTVVGPTTDVIRTESARTVNQDDADAGIITHVDAPPNGFAAGTVFKVRMLNGLSTQKTEIGSQWSAELISPMERDGRILIPAGSIVSGRVTNTHSGRRITGEASMHLEPVSIALPDGSRMALHAQVIDTELGHGIKVDDEGTLRHRDHKAEEAGVLGLTTGSGAVAGALVAGPVGAAVGAGVGAGVSTVLWLKQDRQAQLPKGTELSFELSRPLVVGLQ